MVLASGCMAPGASGPAGDEKRGEVGADELSVAVEAPGEFQFCPEASETNLQNALWLSFFAANAYTENELLAEALGKLGFGAPGEGSELAGCFRAAKQLEVGEVPTDPCFERWSERNQVRADDPYAAAQFLHYLVDGSHTGWDIELLSDATINREQLKWGSTQVLFAKHGTLPLAVIAFRGTESLNDGLVDGKFLRNEFQFAGLDTLVHSGFAGALETVEPALRTKMRSLDPETRVWVTGHSLGAALATVFVGKLMNDGEDQQIGGLHTFGSPRVGNSAYAKQFEKLAEERGIALLRFQNERDPVVHMPPRFGDIFYYHVTHATYFQSDGALRIYLSRSVLPRDLTDDEYEQALRSQDGVSRDDFEAALAKLQPGGTSQEVAVERGIVTNLTAEALARAGDAIIAPHASALYFSNLNNRRTENPGSYRCDF